MENKKRIIVYFSYTNHTKMIAETLKKELGCDIVELNPSKPYHSDYDVVVAEEQNQEASKNIPEIQKIEVDIQAYDEIILGTPVWWYTIAPVIRTFLTQYDFSGKTIIPFATNAGWLGHTFKEIETLCPKAKVEKEMNIVFTEEYQQNKLVTSPNELEKWINQLRT